MPKEELTSQELNRQDFSGNSVKKLLEPKNFGKIFVGVMIAAVLLGIGTGYTLVSNSSLSNKIGTPLANIAPAKTADQDSRTFKDFAEGTVEIVPKSKNPNDYVEGTHLLKRVGTTPVTLTSSVVDLSAYEGKKVKVYGETQKALKAGWLMDVGRVEEVK